MQNTEPTAQRLNQFQIGAIIVALVGFVFSAVGASLDGDHFFRVYLFAFLFWVELSLGCLGLYLLTMMISSPWTMVIRRILGAGARTIPLMAVLFIPLLFGLEQFYPWAAEGAEELHFQTGYLNPGFFLLRAILYFVIWGALAFAITAWADRYDDTGDEVHLRRAKLFSVIGMILFFLTTTFAAFDWMMSLDPEWFSSVFGWLAMSRQALSAMAFVMVLLWFFWKFGPLGRALTEKVLGDLGSITLVALLVWFYLSFIQFVVIWSGNLPSKAAWYIDRSNEGWGGFIFLLILAHAIPFVLLLVPGFKQVRWFLGFLAGWLFFLRLADMYWVVMPSFSENLSLQWWDIMVVLAFGGLWMLLFSWFLRQLPLLPKRDPELEQVLPPEEGSYEAT